MSDLPDPAHALLTDGGPPQDDGFSAGGPLVPAPAGEAVLAPAAGSNATTGTPQAPTGQPRTRTPWLNPGDGRPIASETQPIRVCPHCSTPVPLDAISCTRCGRFAPEHKPARKRLRKHDVDSLIAQVKRDYQPTTTIDHHICENLGLTLAEMKAARPGSPDHQRLLAAVQTITTVLEASRSSRPPPDPTAWDGLTNDEVIDRTTAMLRHLLELRDSQEPFITVADDLRAEEADASCAEEADTGLVQAGLPTAGPTAPEHCPYCRRPCVGQDHPAFAVLHWDDPAEIARRDDEATAVMMKQIGKPPRWDI